MLVGSSDDDMHRGSAWVFHRTGLLPQLRRLHARPHPQHHRLHLLPQPVRGGRLLRQLRRLTVAPVLNVNDFICFLNKYAAGCP